VNVPVTGTYQMEVDYMTQGQRSFFVSVNGSTATELDLNGYSFGTPTSTVIQVQLHAGSNQIEFSNPSNYAPNLDSIIISPPRMF
jgi:alpha-galactosidase